MVRNQLVISYKTLKTLQSVSQRASMLYDMILDTGQINKYDQVVYNTTRAELADVLQCSDRSVSRAINELVKNKLMISRQTQHGIILAITTVVSHDNEDCQKEADFGNPEKAVGNPADLENQQLNPETDENLAILSPDNIRQDTPLLNQGTKDVNQSNIHQSSKGVNQSKRTKKNQIALDIPRAPSEVPRLPVKASDVAGEEHEYPYRGVSMSQSVLFYWGLNRYVMHNIDSVLSKGLLTALSLRIGPIFKQLDNDWEKIRGYVDWYLRRNDKFVRKTCMYGINFFSSMTCFNQYLADKSAEVKIYSSENRKEATSVWLRD